MPGCRVCRGVEYKVYEVCYRVLQYYSITITLSFYPDHLDPIPYQTPRYIASLSVSVSMSMPLVLHFTMKSTSLPPNHPYACASPPVLRHHAALFILLAAAGHVPLTFPRPEPELLGFLLLSTGYIHLPSISKLSLHFLLILLLIKLKHQRS